MKYTSRRLTDAPQTHETVEQFLARGGVIMKCPPGAARNLTDTQARLYVDGKTIPTVGGQLDVRYTSGSRIPLTVDAYDAVQATPLDPNGHHAAEWRQYESDSIASEIRGCATEAVTEEQD